MRIIKTKIFLAIVSLALIYLAGSLSYSYGLQLTPYPQTRAVSKSSNTGSPRYLTKKERDEYKIYLIEQENETNFLYWDEWQLSKVFEKTITQLEREQNSEFFGPIAQRLEQTTHNRLGGGSNPSRPTIPQKDK